MSKEKMPMATESQDSNDARVIMSAKDAAAQLIPPGVDVSKLTPEQQMEMTSNMVQASTLHEKYTANMSEVEIEVFNAVLLVTPKDIPVKDRFKKALDTLSQVGKGKNTAEDRPVEQEDTVKETKTEEKEEPPKQNVAPKGEMDVSGTSSSTGNSNLLSPENESPLGDNDDYFEHLAKKYRQQTTMTRKNQV